MATDYRILVGTLKSNPLFDMEEVNIKGKTIDMMTAVIRLGNSKFNPEEGKRLMHTYAIKLRGQPAKKANEDGWKQDDEVWIVMEGFPTNSGVEMFIAKKGLVGKVGVDGMNMHICIGAVEDGSLDFVGKDDDLELAKIKLRTPKEAYNEDFTHYNPHMNMQAWREKADRVARSLLGPIEEKEDDRHWAIVVCQTVNRRWEDEDGEARWSMTSTIEDFSKLRTKTDKYVRPNFEDTEAEDSGMEAGSTSYSVPVNDDEDIPF